MCPCDASNLNDCDIWDNLVDLPQMGVMNQKSMNYPNQPIRSKGPSEFQQNINRTAVTGPRDEAPDFPDICTHEHDAGLACLGKLNLELKRHLSI